MTPCNPTKPQPICVMCMRHRPDMRSGAIDASVIAKPGACPMAEPVRRTYALHPLRKAA